MATQMFNTVYFLKKRKEEVDVVRVLYKSKDGNHEYVSETIPGSFSMERELMRIKEKYRPLYYVASDVDDALAYIENYVPHPLPDKV